MKSVLKQVVDNVCASAVDPLAAKDSFHVLLSDLANYLCEPEDLIRAYVFYPLASFSNLEDDSFDVFDDKAMTRDTASTFGAHTIFQQIRECLEGVVKIPLDWELA